MTETSLQAHNLDLNNINLSYYIHGNGPQKVLILHGFGSSIKSWEKFISLFPESQYTVLFPELPGFAGSSNPPIPWQVSDYSSFILDLINHLDFKLDYLICHSFGGRISIDLLSQNLLPHTKKAAFIAAAGVRPKLNLKQKFITKVGSTLNFIKSLPILGKPYQYLVTKFRKIIGAGDYNQVSGTMKQTFINVINTDLTENLSSIATPIKLFWGSNDTYTPLYMGHIMNQKIPNSEIQVYTGKKHGLHLTMPENLFQDIITYFNA